MAETIVIIEGLKDEIAKHLFESLKYIYQEKQYTVSDLVLDGLPISLLNPNYNGVSPSELHCRDFFIKILRTKAIILVNDLDHKREEYFTAEYSVDTRYILALSGTDNTTHSPANSGYVPDDTTHRTINTMHPYRNCRNYKEKLIVLLANVKKSILSGNKVRIVHKLFLFTRFTSLSVINSGFSLLYTVDSPVINVLSTLLHSLKKKYTLFVYTGQSVSSILQMHSISELLLIRKGKIKDQIPSSVNIQEIDQSTGILHIVSEITAREKVLVLTNPFLAKLLIKFVKKTDDKTKITKKHLIKLSVLGIKVTEKIYCI